MHYIALIQIKIGSYRCLQHRREKEGTEGEGEEERGRKKTEKIYHTRRCREVLIRFSNEP